VTSVLLSLYPKMI